MKKLAAFILCAALVCALGGCFGDEAAVSPSAVPTAEPSSGASIEPTDEPSAGDIAGEPSAEPVDEDMTDEPTAEPSAEPSVEPSAEPSVEPTPVPKFADLDEYGVVEDESTEYPIVVREEDDSRLTDRAFVIIGEYVDAIVAEPTEDIRALRPLMLESAAAVIDGNTLELYDIRIYITMRDGFAPEGDSWYSLGDGNGWYSHENHPLAVVLNDKLIGTVDTGVLLAEYGVRRSLADDSVVQDDTLLAAYRECAVKAGLAEERGEYTVDVLPWWERSASIYEYSVPDVEVIGADGEDLTATFIELETRASALYDGGFPEGYRDENGKYVRFGRGYESGIYEALPIVSGYEIFEVEERIAEVFTENGRAQILDAEYGGTPLLLHIEEDDSWWYPEARSSGWNFEPMAVETASVSDGRVELLLTFPWGTQGDTKTIPFVMVETDDGWKVDDYRFPKYGFGAENLLHVIEGYDAEFMVYLPDEGYLFVEDARFLGGYWATDVNSACTVWLKDGTLEVELSEDVYDRGQGYSEYGPTVEYTVDLTSGTLIESEVGDFVDNFINGVRYPAPEFTETEMLTWGLLLADIIDDAAAEFEREYGE